MAAVHHGFQRDTEILLSVGESPGFAHTRPVATLQGIFFQIKK